MPQVKGVGGIRIWVGKQCDNQGGIRHGTLASIQLRWKGRVKSFVLV